MNQKVRPRLFMGLIGICFVLLFLIALTLVRFNIAGQFLLLAVSIILSLGFLVLGVFAIALRFGKSITWLETIAIRMINHLYPVAVFVGNVFGVEKDRVRASYIQIRNRLFNLDSMAIKPEEVLLLLPHCIQTADCQFKVTTDVENCRHCGRCVIDPLVKLKQQYGINMSIATGGTIARRVVKELKPRVVLAVACERDLASGLSDIENIQVYGITNERPYGPCFNTTVDIVKIEQILKDVLD